MKITRYSIKSDIRAGAGEESETVGIVVLRLVRKTNTRRDAHAKTVIAIAIAKTKAKPKAATTWRRYIPYNI